MCKELTLNVSFQDLVGRVLYVLVVAGKASIPWLVVLVIVVDSTSSQLDHERLLLEFLEQARSCPPCPPTSIEVHYIRRTRPRAGYTDCLWTRRDFRRTADVSNPPPRCFNSNSGTGARSLVHAPSPCAVSTPVTWASSLSLLSTSLKTVDDAYYGPYRTIDPRPQEGEQSIFGGDQSFFSHTRKD